MAEVGAPSAPAAPSPASEPAAQPVAEQAEPKEQPGDAKEGGEAKPARKLAPIPPGAKPGEKHDKPKPDKDKPRLPGVYAKDDFDPEPLELPRRGADGKFVSRADAEAEFEVERYGDPEEPAAPKPDAKPALPPGVDPPPQKLRLLGKEYKSVAEVEQVVKSVQGQFQSLQAEKTRATEERDYGYRAANEWQKVAEAAQAELARLKGGKPGASAVPDSRPGDAEGEFDVDSLLGDVDVQGFETLALSEKAGLPMAAKYLTAEILRVVNDKLLPRVRDEFNKGIAPFKLSAEERAASDHVEQVANGLRSLRDSKGRPAFPELDAGDQVLSEISSVAKEARISVEQLMTAEGMIQAIGLYRVLKGFMADPDAAAALPNIPSVDGLGAAPGAAALSDAEPGQGLPPNSGRSAGASNPRIARLLKSLDQPHMRDNVLGFARNPRVS